MLKSSSAKSHDEVDFPALVRLYEPLASSKKLCGDIVASPFHLYSVEALRDTHELRTGKEIAADVFVIAHGEPTERHVTKVGGLPYWSAHEPWPRSAAGKPYWFLAQFNFSDSRDLFPDLPGDVLLILTEDEAGWLWDGQESIRCEWRKINDQPLISAEGLGSFEYDYDHLECYGVLHRTADYPDSAERASELEVGQSYNLAVLNATKIGGAPGFVQGNPEFPGTFLAQLASIQPAPDVPYPWVNRKEPFDVTFGENGIYKQQQTIGDMGSLYLFLQEDGSVKCTVQSY